MVKHTAMSKLRSASDLLVCVLAQNAYIIVRTAAKLVGVRTVDFSKLMPAAVNPFAAATMSSTFQPSTV
jgi:hypothetical protein